MAYFFLMSLCLKGFAIVILGSVIIIDSVYQRGFDLFYFHLVCLGVEAKENWLF